MRRAFAPIVPDPLVLMLVHSLPIEHRRGKLTGMSYSSFCSCCMAHGEVVEGHTLPRFEG